MTQSVRFKGEIWNELDSWDHPVQEEEKSYNLPDMSKVWVITADANDGIYYCTDGIKGGLSYCRWYQICTLRWYSAEVARCSKSQKKERMEKAKPSIYSTLPSPPSHHPSPSPPHSYPPPSHSPHLLGIPTRHSCNILFVQLILFEITWRSLASPAARTWLLPGWGTDRRVSLIVGESSLRGACQAGRRGRNDL